MAKATSFVQEQLFGSDPQPQGLRRIGATNIHVGTAGWYHNDWVGTFYPSGSPRTRLLELYQHHFAALELNSTFHAIPAAAGVAKLIENTRPGFRIVAKAFRGITHDAGPPESAQRFVDALRPLRDAGRLRAVLLQYPPSFHADGANLASVLAAAQTVGALGPAVAEFRHASWGEPAILSELRGAGVILCAVDTPEGIWGPRELETPIGYVRLHSRNSADWWAGGPARYDWFYRKHEMRQWLDRIVAAGDRLRDVYVFFNNCVRGQAAINARTFLRMLEDGTEAAD